MLDDVKGEQTCAIYGEAIESLWFFVEIRPGSTAFSGNRYGLAREEPER